MKMKYQNEDLFSDTTMTFGEHLDELRSALLKAMVGLAVGVAIGLAVGRYVVLMLEEPLVAALAQYYNDGATETYKKFAAELRAQGKEPPYTTQQLETLKEHGLIFEIRYVHPQAVLAELNIAPPPPKADDEETPEPPATTPQADDKRVAVPRLDATQLVPWLIWQPIELDSRVSPKTFSAPEAFSIWFKAALVAGVVISSPWVFYHIWAFVAAGLYPHEKKYVHIFLPFSIGLFLLGAATAFLFVFEPVMDFLFGFNKWLGLDPDPRISEWLGFVLLLPLGFGISFQLPLVMLFLERIGVFDVTAYLTKWRISVMVIFILAALLTPADPYSMLLMAIPLTFLYFGGILLCRFMPKSRKPMA